MRKLLLMMVALASGCGSKDSSVSVGNQNPLGVVGGMVLDGATESPMPMVTVSLVTAGKALTATTDTNGLFSIDKVPSGDFIATFSSTGYQSAIVNGTLGGAVGNFPVKDPTATLGPLGILKNDGTFAVKIVNEDGTPAANVQVTARPQVRYVTFTNGVPAAVGTYEVTATSGMDGVVNITGLPEFSTLGSLGFGAIDDLPIDVPPVQVSGSMTQYTFLGGTFPFRVDHLGDPNSPETVNEPTITLAGPSTPLNVINSSIDLLVGVGSGTGTASSNPGSNGTVSPNLAAVSVYKTIQPTEMMTIDFNQAINKSTLRADLLDEQGSTLGPLMATVSTNLLTVTPAAALTAGSRVNLALHVDSATTPGSVFAAHELNVTVPLFVAPATGTKIAVVANSVTASKNGSGTVLVDFQFNMPIGMGFARNDGISCVAYYDLQGLGLDNNGGKIYPGEWGMNAAGTDTSCPTPGFDITRAFPKEPTNMPVTGYTTHWEIQPDNLAHDECQPGVQPDCQLPSPGPITTHLLFSHTGGGNTFKQPDGTPVQDNIANTTFNYTCTAATGCM